MPRVGICQLTATNDLNANLQTMRNQFLEAVAQGAEVVAFPEMAYFSGKKEQWLKVLPEYPKLLHTFASWAREKNVFMLPGSLREPSDEEGRYFNTLPLFSPAGEQRSTYRKLFLFQANLPDKVYNESAYCKPGTELTVAETVIGKLGLAICFDLRFPELFRGLKKRGAEIIFLPASFTVPTGLAHWHTLVRARAIENQCFVVAPGQTGKIGEGAATFGHSIIVNPWGEVLCDLQEEIGVRVLKLDLSEIAAAKAKVAAWECTRPELFPLA